MAAAVDDDEDFAPPNPRVKVPRGKISQRRRVKVAAVQQQPANHPNQPPANPAMVSAVAAAEGVCDAASTAAAAPAAPPKNRFTNRHNMNHVWDEAQQEYVQVVPKENQDPHAGERPAATSHYFGGASAAGAPAEAPAAAAAAAPAPPAGAAPAIRSTSPHEQAIAAKENAAAGMRLGMAEVAESDDQLLWS